MFWFGKSLWKQHTSHWNYFPYGCRSLCWSKFDFALALIHIIHLGFFQVLDSHMLAHKSKASYYSSSIPRICEYLAFYKRCKLKVMPLDHLSPLLRLQMTHWTIKMFIIGKQAQYYYLTFSLDFHFAILNRNNIMYILSIKGNINLYSSYTFMCSIALVNFKPKIHD